MDIYDSCNHFNKSNHVGECRTHNERTRKSNNPHVKFRYMGKTLYGKYLGVVGNIGVTLPSAGSQWS